MNQSNDTNMAFMTDEGQEVPAEERKFNHPKGRGEVILVIEDEEMLRDFLQTILSGVGYKVILAADGAEGLLTFMEHKEKINLVLLDMGLPRMSGEDVLSGIVWANPGVKIICVSGSIDPWVQESAFQIGATDYISKPYLIDDLLMKVHRTLK